MAEQRGTVARVTFGGSVMGGSGPIEIWASSLHIAPFGTGVAPVLFSDDDFSSLDEESYLDNQAVPSLKKLAAGFQGSFRLDYVKVNKVKVERRTSLKSPNGYWTAVQNQPTTHLREGLNVTGTGTGAQVPLDTCQGFTFYTSGQSRGRGSLGRMFLPPYGQNIGDGRWTANGNYPDVRLSGMRALLAGLVATTAQSAATIRPVLAALPSAKTSTGPASFLVNALDRIVVEDIPFVQRRRKSALKGVGAKLALSA